jgi:hypothetical protein
VGIPPIDISILGYTGFWIWAWTWALIKFGGGGCIGASLIKKIDKTAFSEAT